MRVGGERMSAGQLVGRPQANRAEQRQRQRDGEHQLSHGSLLSNSSVFHFLLPYYTSNIYLFKQPSMKIRINTETVRRVEDGLLWHGTP